MKIIKRNGKEVQFDELKITAAIEKTVGSPSIA